MMFKVAVYGSLKEGRYNHPIIEGAKFVGKTTVKGYMTLVYSYPQLFLTEDGDEHEVEVYLIDETQYSRCHSIEIGAGYVEKRVDTEHGSCIMWVYENKDEMSGHYITKY
jgi:gamma-glutamylcyclotransferase (GGCT)/AIG2-like uncharacterized protein YtfP